MRAARRDTGNGTSSIYLAGGPSGKWGNYVKGPIKEWELLGIIEPPSKEKLPG